MSSDARARLPSIRLLVTLIVVIPITVVSAALIAITTVSSNRIAEQLGREIVVNTTAQVSNDVRAYLGSAVRVSDLYVRRLLDGTLSASDLPAWERALFDDLAVNTDVASICFSTLDGDCTWLLHAHNRLELGLVRGNDKEHAIEYAADASGNVDREKPIRVYHYDATARPWFKAALESSQPKWTPIYFWFGEGGPASETGTGYTRVVRDRAGNALGVLVIDVTLGALSAHLKDFPITRSGHAFIVDEQGLIVAASDGRVNSIDGKRISPADSDSAAARAIADLVRRLDQPDVDHSSRVMLNDQPVRVQATDLEPYPGIKWHVVTVLPESSFLAQATTVQRRAIILAVCAIVAGLALGLFLSRRLSDPLMSLSAHAARIGAGNFDSRLHLSKASELRDVSDELNRMAGALKERMKLAQALKVAEEVQQSLLPHAIPTIAGVELAACIEYCDSTGGDYYDFIEVDREGRERQTLLVVGDVTGHGIGAALLMATARGAVRTSAQSADTLGDVLTSANRALADSRNGMFMTMTILAIDPQSRTIRWASAGHDPAIVYHPDTGGFEELHAMDYPLGVEPHVRYREFTCRSATPGTIVMIGTDGIWEARNENDEMFGKDRLRALIRANSSSPDQLAAAIRRAMETHKGELPLADDVTFVIARVL